MKIAKIGENVDSTSKRILALGTIDMENTSNGPRPQNPRLYQMIRTTAMIFLKEHVLTIPSLPSEEEYAEMIAKREARIQERIAFDKQQEMEESQREKRSEQKTNGRNSHASSSAKNEVFIIFLYRRTNSFQTFVPSKEFSFEIIKKYLRDAILSRRSKFTIYNQKITRPIQRLTFNFYEND